MTIPNLTLHFYELTSGRYLDRQLKLPVGGILPSNSDNNLPI